MMKRSILNQQALTGSLLITSMLVVITGVILYTGREIWNWSAARTMNYLRLERAAIMVAVFVLALGLILLARLLQAAGSPVLAYSGLGLFLAGCVLVLTAEALFLLNQVRPYRSVEAFVILAFLGQAVLGMALQKTRLLLAWVGWATTAWNLSWMVILLIVSPRDMYYPLLHYVAPLLIGIALLLKRQSVDNHEFEPLKDAI